MFRVRNRSSWLVNSCLSLGPIGGGPPATMPPVRSSSIRLRIRNSPLTLSSVYNSPRGLRPVAPFSTMAFAKGISAVMTRSPGETRRAISLSASSKPAGTTIELISGDDGIERDMLATSVSSICRRVATLKRISLMTLGQASASTHMCIVIR